MNGFYAHCVLSVLLLAILWYRLYRADRQFVESKLWRFALLPLMWGAAFAMGDVFFTWKTGDGPVDLIFCLLSESLLPLIVLSAARKFAPRLYVRAARLVVED